MVLTQGNVGLFSLEEVVMLWVSQLQKGQPHGALLLSVNKGGGENF